MKTVMRTEDMSATGRLQLMQQDDGDIIVTVTTVEMRSASVEFCLPGSGGGRSPRTIEALRNLMAAMEMDNTGQRCEAPETAPEVQP